MKAIRWSNIPIPEGHIAFLLLGSGLQHLRPRRLIRSARIRHGLGGPMLLSGVLLAGWAVRTVQDQDIQDPSQLVTTGPYAYSRNPMYLAWHSIYLAMSVLANSAWLLALLPAVILFTHLSAVKPEERYLEQAFGERYRLYQSNVSRYF